MGTPQIAQLSLIVHFAATFFMVGLIWFVQIAHYPLMSQVSPEQFRQYEIDHQRLTSWVVVPVMLTELLTAVSLIWLRPASVTSIAVWVGLALLLSIWLITFTVQAPQHASLEAGYDAKTLRALVLGNWFRTITWSARGLVVVWMVAQWTRAV